MDAITTDVERVSREYLAAWSAADLDRIMAWHADDTTFVLHAPAAAGPAVGKPAVRAAFADVLAQWQGLAVETTRLLLGDAHWVLDWTLVAAPGGQEVRLPLIDVVTVDPGGLVARKDTYLASGATR